MNTNFANSRLPPKEIAGNIVPRNTRYCNANYTSVANYLNPAPGVVSLLPGVGQLQRLEVVRGHIAALAEGL